MFYFWATAAAQTLVAIVKKLADLSILSLTNWYGLNQKLQVKVECSTVVKLKESRGFESLEKKNSRLTDKRIFRWQEPDAVEVDVSAVAVVQLDVDEVRVQLRVDGHRVRDCSGVEVVVLRTPVRADPSPRDQGFS